MKTMSLKHIKILFRITIVVSLFIVLMDFIFSGFDLTVITNWKGILITGLYTCTLTLVNFTYFIFLDGGGTAWEHLDSYYLRNNSSTANAGSFDVNNWTFGALNSLDGEGLCNSSSALSTLVSLGSNYRCRYRI